MNRHLSETEIRSMLDDPCAITYETLSFGLLGPNLTLGRYQDTFSDAFDTFWAAVPDEPTPNHTSYSASTQCPEPGAFAMVPVTAAFALRCSANTLSTGARCRYQTFYPHTLCEVHVDYFSRHGHLPPGGADRPFIPHPDDYWPAFKPRVTALPRPGGLS